MAARYVDRLEQVEKLREAVKPIVCTTLSDIANALERFSVVENKTVSFSVDVAWKDDNKPMVDKVTGSSSGVSLYQLLIEGMDLVKKRIEVTDNLKDAIKAAEEADDEMPLQNMTIWDVDNLRFSVDSLIEKRLGGKRHGLRIRWTVQEGIFEYDPYARKMFEITDK